MQSETHQGHQDSEIFSNRALISLKIDFLGRFLEKNCVFLSVCAQIFVRPQFVVVEYNLQFRYLQFILPHKSPKVNIYNSFLEKLTFLRIFRQIWCILVILRPNFFSGSIDNVRIQCGLSISLVYLTKQVV